MAEDLTDRLIKNLEEVDKSLRRSYIFQIILCLLLLYLFYNAVTVADQTKSIDHQLNETKCALSEFDKVNDFIGELVNERYDFYEFYSRKINELSDKFQIKDRKADQYQSKSSIYDIDQERIKKVLNEYHLGLNDALRNALYLKSNISEVDLDDLMIFVRVLRPLDQTTTDQVKQFLKQESSIADQLKAKGYIDPDSSLRGIQEVIQEVSGPKAFIDHTCSISESIAVFGSSRAINVRNRLAVLESIHKRLGNQNEVRRDHIESHQIKLSGQRQKLQEANISEINIPFAGQTMNTNFAFRIGPFVILLIQFLICSYFRHRYGLIKKIKSSFETTDDSDPVKLEDIHLILWPWILNFPYYKSDKYKAERQKGARIIELLLSFFQFLPVITIAVIAIRPFYLGTTGSLETMEINLTDWAFIATSSILLVITFFQVRYSRNLDGQITALLEWKQAAATPLLAYGMAAAGPWKFKYTLLLFFGLITNFSFHVLPILKIDLAILAPLLTIFAGYRFGRIRALMFGATISGLWMILYIVQMVEVYGFDPALLTRPMAAGGISFPHSSPLAFIRLCLLGYFSGWIFEHIRMIKNENQLSLGHPPPAEKSSNFQKVKTLSFAVLAVMVIVAGNLRFQGFPSGLAIVLCAVFGYRFGPRSGAALGVAAILISFIARIVLDEMDIGVRINYYETHSMLSFGIIGYWSGYFGMLLKYKRDEIQRMGNKISLWSIDEAKGSRWTPILILLLAITAFLYYSVSLNLSFNAYFRIVLIPLPTAIIMVIGTLYGPRKAAWITGISLGAFLIICYTAIAYEWRLGFSLSDNIFFAIRIFRWSIVSIAIYIVAAYWSGKIDLIENKRNQYWLAIGVFAAFQVAAILRFGTFLSLSSLSGNIGEFRFDILTSPVQLLEPWLTVYFYNLFLKLLKRV